MTTTANESTVYCPVPAGDSSVAPKESVSKQTFALKVQHNDDIRRIVCPELTVESLIKKAAEVFKLREPRILLKYQDSEGDLVTITTDEDLFDAQRIAMQRGTLLRLTLALKKPREAGAQPKAASHEVPLQLQDPFADVSSPLAYRQQKKALKEQKKRLKESALADASSPLAYRQQKKALKEQKKCLKEEKKESKKEWKLLKKEAKHHAKIGAFNLPAEATALPQEEKRWRDLTPEEKVARRMAKRQANEEERAARREARIAERRKMMQERGVRNKVVARFVKHITIPDGTKLEPNQPFVKTWRMRNEGETDWINCKLLFVSKRNGDILGAASEEVAIASPVPTGAEIDISVNMVAPEQPGRYVGFWRLANAEGRKFGQRIWVKVDVVCSSSSSDEEPKSAAPSYDNLEDEVAASFIEIKEEKEVPPAEPAPSQPTMAELLRKLKDLGFTDVGKNIPLLKKHNGGIHAVITELLA